MIELWQIAKTVWKVSGACLLIFLLCITKDERKVETFNSFGKRFGNTDTKKIMGCMFRNNGTAINLLLCRIMNQTGWYHPPC